MKKHFLSALTLATACLLAACGKQNTSSPSGTSSSVTSSSTVTSSSSTSSSEEEKRIKGRIYDDSEVFNKVGDTYVANGSESYKVFPNKISEGSYKSTLTNLTSGKEAGLIFNYLPGMHTYDRLGVRKDGKIQVIHFDGESFGEEQVISEAISGQEITISIRLFQEFGYIAVSINGRKEINVDVAPMDDSYFGLYSEVSNMTFKNIEMSRDAYIEDNKAENYRTSIGRATIKDNKFEALQQTTVILNDKKGFTNGVLEYTYKATGNTNTVGCFFCVDDAGLSTFWRNPGVSYYYLGVSVIGSFYLYKCENQTWTAVKYLIAPMFDDSVEHTVRIIKNNSYFEFYLDGHYLYSYEDASVLTGQKFGMCSLYDYAYFKNIKVNEMPTIRENDLDNIDVYHGGFVSYFQTIRANKAQSLCLMKDEMDDREGTITTTIGGANTSKNERGNPYFGYGVIFNVTKPQGASSFYETESGLSYYYFVNDGEQYFKLVKIVNGATVYTSDKKYVALSIEHGGDVRIVIKGNHIYCYFTDRLIVDYLDNSPLTGKGYGFKATYAGASFTHSIYYSTDTNIDTAEYIIFGHSYTHLWLNYRKDFAPLGDDVLDIGIGGANTSHYVKYINEMAAYNSEWGIYWNGINDINAGIWDATTMANYVEATMEGIKALNPKFKCVVVGINRCTYEVSMGKYAEISAANAKYKEVCDRHDYLTFLDVEKLYCDENGVPQAKYFIDNLHPTKGAYQMVAEKIINIIKSK